MSAGNFKNKCKLPKQWQDKAYRDAYVEATAEQKLCMQLHMTREARGWSRSELARRAKVSRHTIAKYEGGDSASNLEIKMSTLLKLAHALDVAVCIEIVPFSQLAKEKQHLSVPELTVAAFPG